MVVRPVQSPGPGTLKDVMLGLILCFLHLEILFFLFYWIYWGDIGYQNFTDFKFTILQHIICTLYCVFTTPSQVSIHHHLNFLIIFEQGTPHLHFALVRGVQPFGLSVPHWKKNCLGTHIKYIVTHNHKNNLIVF